MGATGGTAATTTTSEFNKPLTIAHSLSMDQIFFNNANNFLFQFNIRLAFFLAEPVLRFGFFRFSYSHRKVVRRID